MKKATVSRATMREVHRLVERAGPLPHLKRIEFKHGGVRGGDAAYLRRSKKIVVDVDATSTYRDWNIKTDKVTVKPLSKADAKQKLLTTVAHELGHAKHGHRGGGIFGEGLTEHQENIADKFAIKLRKSKGGGGGGDVHVSGYTRHGIEVQDYTRSRPGR